MLFSEKALIISLTNSESSELTKHKNTFFSFPFVKLSSINEVAVHILLISKFSSKKEKSHFKLGGWSSQKFSLLFHMKSP